MELNVSTVKQVENLFSKTQKYVDCCNNAAGKNFRSILQIKPNSFNGIKPAELRPAPEIKSDTFQKAKKIESWFSNTPNPYSEEGKTMVEGHHNFNSWNPHTTLEEMIRQTKVSFSKKLNTDLNRLEASIERKKIMNAQDTVDIHETNQRFKNLMPQPRDSVVYRGRSRRTGELLGSDFDVIKNAKIGDEIVPAKGFAYAAHFKADTSQYLGFNDQEGFEGLLLECRIPKGSQVSVNMEHGGEVVFPGLSKYKLVSKETRYIKTRSDDFYNRGEAKPYTHAVLEYIPEIPTETPEDVMKLAQKPLF